MRNTVTVPGWREEQVSRNGISVHVRSSGSGRSLVFIHGLGWDCRMWSRELQLLSPSYRVIAADTRGHGLSSRPAGPYGVVDIAQDWIGVIEALDLGRVCLVGFSQGGLVAQTIALTRPDLVGALVLACTAGRVGNAGPETGRDRRSAALVDGDPLAAARIVAACLFSDRWRGDHPAYVEEFALQWAGAAPEPLKAAIAAAKGLDLRKRLHSLAVPTLVMAAAEDRIMPPAAARELTALIPGAETVTVPASGHMLPVEQPEAFHAALSNFLRQHWPGSR